MSRPLTTFIVVDNNFDNGDNGDDEEEEEEEEDDEEEKEDLYKKIASSEFKDEGEKNSSALARMSTGSLTSDLDWGGALGKLRQRVEDVETGKSQDPSNALFRLMSAKTPNQLIGTFVSNANPKVVKACSDAVNSLLGGLSSPAMGIETIVKTNGEKIGNLCFQLQMTGYVLYCFVGICMYLLLHIDELCVCQPSTTNNRHSLRSFFLMFDRYMFRNAEYVLALKDLMKIKSSATLQDYKVCICTLGF